QVAARLFEHGPHGRSALAAHHWRLAGNRQAAIEAALTAGKEAQERGGPSEALGDLMAVADLADHPEVLADVRGVLWEAIGDAQRHAAPGQAIPAYERALASFAQVPDSARRCLRKLGLAHS